MTLLWEKGTIVFLMICVDMSAIFQTVMHIGRTAISWIIIANLCIVSQASVSIEWKYCEGSLVPYMKRIHAVAAIITWRCEWRWCLIIEARSTYRTTVA